jgi:hypothetical protein
MKRIILPAGDKNQPIIISNKNATRKQIYNEFGDIIDEAAFKQQKMAENVNLKRKKWL